MSVIQVCIGYKGYIVYAVAYLRTVYRQLSRSALEDTRYSLFPWKRAGTCHLHTDYMHPGVIEAELCQDCSSCKCLLRHQSRCQKNTMNSCFWIRLRMCRPGSFGKQWQLLDFGMYQLDKRRTCGLQPQGDGLVRSSQGSSIHTGEEGHLTDLCHN